MVYSANGLIVYHLGHDLLQPVALLTQRLRTEWNADESHFVNILTLIFYLLLYFLIIPIPR